MGYIKIKKYQWIVLHKTRSSIRLKGQAHSETQTATTTRRRE